jgi:hypothetical protein
MKRYGNTANQLQGSLAARRWLATAGIALAVAGGTAQAQDSACPKPLTAAAMTEQFRMLNWKETDYVIQHEPGMKKVYDKIPPAYQAQIQADPKAFPWERITANRSPETMERVAGLIRDARAQSIAQTLAAQPWPKVKAALSRDAEYQAALKNPKGTPLEGAEKDPRGFDWKGLLVKRDVCQLTALKQTIEAAGVAAN